MDTEVMENLDNDIFEGWDVGVEDVDETAFEDDSQYTNGDDSENGGVDNGVDEGESSVDKPKYDNASDKPTVVHYKYNGEEGDLTAEEASSWVQKGMNYDKVNSKYESLKHLEGKEDYLDFVMEVAEANGIEPEELMEDWRVKRIAAVNNISEDAARVRYLKDNINNGKAKPSAKKTPEEVEAEAKAKMNADFENFAKAYPEVKPEQIPVEVWQDYKDNHDLERAWLKHAYKNRNRTDNTEAKNQSRSTGSMKPSRVADADAWMFEGW